MISSMIDGFENKIQSSQKIPTMMSQASKYLSEYYHDSIILWRGYEMKNGS